MQICDMVAIAYLMNATLVLPSLDHQSFWDDPRYNNSFYPRYDLALSLKLYGIDTRLLKYSDELAVDSKIFLIGGISFKF